MRSEGIVGAHVPARRRRDGDGVLGVAGVRAWPDLLKRDFSPAAPNQAWCADMKQIQTGEGVLHLASVLDLYSRAIVGWAMSPVADADLVATALEMGVARRRPGDGLVHHSDAKQLAESGQDGNEALDLDRLTRVVVERLEIVEITTQQGDNAHRIFQSLNGTGVRRRSGRPLRCRRRHRCPALG